MADKNIQIRDLAGNNLFPKTTGSVVFNNAGENLGAVEAGAQVNVLEGVQLNGADVAIVDKKANIVLPAAAEYTIVQQETAEAGYASTYYLAKDGVQAGAKINIAKDMVLDTVELKTCTEADKPVAGFKKGDKYIEFTFLNKEQTKMYLLVSDLVDIYTEGAGINVVDNVISVDTTDTAIQGAIEAGSVKFVQAGVIHTALATKQDNITASNKLKSDLVDTTGQTNLFVTAAEKTAWNGKQAALTEAQMAAVNSGITADKVTGYDAHLANADIHVTTADKAEWSGKQDAITASNKLSAELVATTETLQFVSKTEKDTWNGKQDAIADLATIRSGAAAGATALQQADVSSAYVANGTAPINSKAIANLITYVELS